MHRITALLSSLALLAGLFVYAPQSVRALDPVYIGPAGGSGECASPLYDTDGSADDEQFQTAVDAQDEDIDNILYVCPGTYDIDAEIVVADSLTIEGVSGAAATVLDASGIGYSILGADSDLIIRGLTFKDGTATNGGAIYVQGDLTVEDSAFINNVASNDGGAINIQGDLDLVADSTFTDNEATSGYGGALYVHWDLYIVSDSEFTGNSASQGGAINVNYSLDLVADSTFTDNEATDGYGGAIRIQQDLDLIESSLFSKNSASGGGGAVFVDDDVSDFNGNGAAGLVSNIFEGNEAQDGGAVQIDDEFSVAAVITRNTFLNNVGDDGGAIDFDDLVGGTISSNKFIGNYATGDGGAIDADDIVSSTVITRNLFSRNTSEDDGGAMWLSDDDEGSELATISGNTFRGNRAADHGGGIYMSFMDSDFVPTYVTRNSFRSNRAGGVGGGIAIMGLAGCAPELTTRQAARAFKKNKYTSNRATGSRRTADVGAVPCVD